MLKACNHPSGTCLDYAVPGHARCKQHLAEQNQQHHGRRRSAPGDGAARRLRDEIRKHPLVLSNECKTPTHPANATHRFKSAEFKCSLS